MKVGIIKHRIAAGLLVLATLLSGYYSLFINPSIELIRDDGAAKWEERMRPLREVLSPSVREVGYISDPDQAAQVNEYSLTRYALAPVVVHQGVNYEWIIGNFTQPGFEDILKEQIHAESTVQKFGAGIYLIHRKLQ
jgi:hypothetical protein